VTFMTITNNLALDNNPIIMKIPNLSAMKLHVHLTQAPLAT